MFFVHHAVLNGIGLGVLPRFLAEADVQHGRLIHLYPAWTAVSGHLWFLTPASARAPSTVTAFRALLEESLALKEMVLVQG